MCCILSGRRVSVILLCFLLLSYLLTMVVGVYVFYVCFCTFVVYGVRICVDVYSVQ